MIMQDKTLVKLDKFATLFFTNEIYDFHVHPRQWFSTQVEQYN